MTKDAPIGRKALLQRVNTERKAAAKASEAAKKAAAGRQVAISGMLAQGITSQDEAAVISQYVQHSGTKQQRRMVEQIERQFNGGKTLMQVKNAEALKANLAAVENAQTLEDLKALEKSFGNMMGSAELRKAMEARKEAIKFEADFAEALRQERFEGLMEKFGRKPAELGSANPTKASGLSRSELYRKLMGKEAPTVTSNVALCDEIAANKIKIGELTGKMPEINRAMSSGEAAIYADGLAQRAKDAETIAQQAAQAAKDAEKIAQQTAQAAKDAETIAQQAAQHTKDAETISQQAAKIAKNKQILKWGAIGLGIAAIGVGIALLIGRNKKNKQVEEQQKANEELQAKNEELARQLEEKEQQAAVQQGEAPAQEAPKAGARGEFTRLVVKGDAPWNHCKDQLEKDLGRKATDAEILKVTAQYLEDNKIKLEADNYTAIIHPNDSLFWNSERYRNIALSN